MISPAQQFMIAYHIAHSRPDLAAIVRAFPVAFFAEMDGLMRGAWLAGAADASLRRNER